MRGAAAAATRQSGSADVRQHVMLQHSENTELRQHTATCSPAVLMSGHAAGRNNAPPFLLGRAQHFLVLLDLTDLHPRNVSRIDFLLEREYRRPEVHGL